MPGQQPWRPLSHHPPPALLAFRLRRSPALQGDQRAKGVLHSREMKVGREFRGSPEAATHGNSDWPANAPAAPAVPKSAPPALGCVSPGLEW